MGIHFLFDINWIIFFLCNCVEQLTISNTLSFFFCFLGWFFFNFWHLVHSSDSFKEMIYIFGRIFLFWDSLEIIFTSILIIFLTAALIYLFLLLILLLWFFFVGILVFDDIFLSLFPFLWVFAWLCLLFRGFLLKLEFD